MSSATILFLSSSASVQQSRYLLSSLWDRDYRIVTSSGSRAFHCSSSKQGISKVVTSDRPNRNRSIAAKAGLGRLSGAVHHGNSQRKYRRRREPQQRDEDSENTRGSEDNRQGRQEGDDSENGGGYENLVSDAVHDDGSSPDQILSEPQNLEDGTFSPSVHDGLESPLGSSGALQTSHDEASGGEGAELSHKRYLEEMGVMRVYNDGRDSESGALPHSSDDMILKDVHDDGERSSAIGHQRSSEGTNHDVAAGQVGGDDQGTKTSSSSQESEDKPFGRTASNIDEIVPVAPSVLTNLKRLQETSESDDGGQNAEGGSGGEARTAFQAKEVERLGFQEGKSLTTAGNRGFPAKSKEQPKKRKKKLATVSFTKLEERVDNGRVRVVEGGAEQPATPTVLSRHPSESGLKEIVPVHDSVTALQFAETVAEPMLTEREEEETEKPARNKQNGNEADYRQIINGSKNNIQDLILAEVDLNSMTDTGNNGNLLPYIEQAGATGILVSSGAAGEQEGLLLSMVPSGALGQDSEIEIRVPAVVEQALQVASKVVPVEVVEQAAQVASKVAELPAVVVEHAAQVGSQVVEQVVEILPDVVTEQVTDVAEQVANTVSEVSESVSSTASQVVEQVTEFFSDDDDIDSDSDDEFEAYKTSDLPEFRGKQGLDNFIVKQEGDGVLTRIYDFYSYMLKQPLPEFAAAMFSAPILLSLIFTLLYLPQFEGLAFDEAARDFVVASGGDALMLHVSAYTIFQVFMFSLSLSTGLQPGLAPISPYTLVVANLNALVAQLVFVFLSGAVFARLSQPSQPVRFSTVALISTTPAQRKRKEKAVKVLVARYVLSGPQPCELVDVKVDLTYKYNTLTRAGSYFRATQSLKLVRAEIAFLTHGMLVRHLIDEASPLYQRTPEMLANEDAVFCLSVGGLERSSMQAVFHVQHYCVVDNDIIWDAEFEDLILINKKNKRVVDHSRLSLWKPLQT